MFHYLAAAALFTAPMQAPLQGQQPAPVAPRDVATTTTALRATQAPAIDGRNDDAVWRAAPKVSDFTQFDPNAGAAPSFRTEFQVAYDDRNLYVFVRAHDPHPDSIMRALTRRDVRGPSDQIVVFVDSYDDNRTGFDFNVNPDGVKRDYAIYNDGQEDGSWNAVWDVATLVDDEGWTAEFRIPLSQLRYSAKDSHTFGFGVWRDIERFKERISWPVYNTQRNGLVSQLGNLEGLTGITMSPPLEMTPYTVAKNETRQRPDGRYERANGFTIGGDLKYGITPNVTLDATVNPDFGQVEADPAVLNLTAFETFLSERRPFFVEGTGRYQFQLNCYIVVDCQTGEGLFYSRRIGRQPLLRRDYGDVTTPTSTPIATAAKLTGRTGGGLSFGLLDAVTQHVDGTEGRSVEPRTNYAVLRAEQDLRSGNAGVSWIATAVNRALDEWTDPFMHKSAYATGLSFRNRFHNGQYELAGQLTASRVEGTPDVIARTQRNAVHYYQQPGDDAEYDPTRTSLSGHGQQLKFGKYGGGILRFETSFVRQSAGFEVNDLGYLRRADVQDWSTWAALSFRTPKWGYRWAQFNANHWETWNTSGMRLQNAINVNGHVGLENNWNLHLGGTVDGLGESSCDRCTRGGPPLRSSRGFFPWGGINGDSRKMIVPSMWFNLGRADEGNTHSLSLSPSVLFRFSTSLTASLGANISRAERDAQWYGNFTNAANVTHYSFARLDQRTMSMNMRVNYTATPTLTLEFYGEPFMSNGTYSNIRELSATPGAADYASRFKPFAAPAGASKGFSVRQLRTNAVARWEYLPGSTIFLVWAHGRQGSDPTNYDRRWTDEYTDLFNDHPDNTFLIKVAYWLSR